MSDSLIIDHFPDDIVPITECGCWIWMKRLDSTGYGRIWFDARRVQAHRLSWLMTRGEIPEGIFVCHRCDIRSCVNPDHLFLGTHAENMQDMYRKGRDRSPRGDQHGRTKLTHDDVLIILNSNESARVLSGRFNVSINTIRRSRAGRCYRSASILAQRVQP